MTKFIILITNCCCCWVVSQLFVTPWTAAHQASLLIGFPRQEYWSGLPCPLPGHLPDSGIKPTFPASLALQADSLTAEPQGKPKNTGVGSLSLLQRIFPTQELNRGLLHCRQIHYQLNHQGSQREEREVKKERQKMKEAEILLLAVFCFVLFFHTHPYFKLSQSHGS